MAKKFSENSSTSRSAAEGIRKWLALAWGIVWTVLLASAAFTLWVRRAEGMFTTPLGSGWLFLSSFFATLVTVVTFCMLSASMLDDPPTPPRQMTRRQVRRKSAFLAWSLVMLLLLLLIRLAILIPGTPYPGQVCWRLSFPLALIVFLLIGIPMVFGRQEEAHRPAESEPRDPVDEEEAAELEAEITLPPGVTQQLSRTAGEDGDSLEGLLRARFTSNQSRTTLHVAFCPPFEEKPAVECYVLEGEAKIETPLRISPHGAGIQLKKIAGEEAVLYFRAVSPPDK